MYHFPFFVYKAWSIFYDKGTYIPVTNIFLTHSEGSSGAFIISATILKKKKKIE